MLGVAGLADALAAWMAAAGLGRADFLGNSFGCQIIADLAARHPEWVRRAVLQGPTAPPDERTWLRQFVSWRRNAPHIPERMNDVADIDCTKCGVVRALASFDLSLRDRLETKLAAIAAPVLVVRGSIELICRQDRAETVARGVPDGRLAIIPGVAHTLVFTAPETAPEALAAVSRPFLDATAPG